MINLQEGYWLLHHGARALAAIQDNGMRIDMAYANEMLKQTGEGISEYTAKVENSPEGMKWMGVYGKKMDTESGPQLADILYNHMGYELKKTTENGNPSVDAEALEMIDTPFIKDLLYLRKLGKIHGTYLKSILREVTTDGYIHPNFNLNRVVTYRSSSDNPNFQNVPIRDPEMGKLIRRCFVPRPGRMIVEIDYSGIEVKISSCYNLDPVLIRYNSDKTKDMHRDMACQCYILEPDQIHKPIRYCGKNKFVFPEFYGDYYKNCAMSLWEAITTMKLVTTDGIPLKEHLKTKGITNYLKFESHIQKVEDDFWNRRFKVYTQWKKDWYSEYLTKGYFDTKTGFRCAGYMGKNDVINYPVQGSAFHCLLWSLIKLQQYIERKKMRSCIVGQIHDSVVADVVPEELNEFLSVTNRIMSKDLPQHWPWIIVPIEVEAEIAPVDASWFDKDKINLEDYI